MMTVKSVAQIACVLACCSSALAVPVQWSVQAGGNGDYYERVDVTGNPFTFEQAEAAAAASTFNGVPGHLVVFDNNQYAAELDFVYNNVYFRPAVPDLDVSWIGGYRPSNTGVSKYENWFWLGGVPIPTSITNNWFIDQFEGPGDEGAVLGKIGNRIGDYTTSDSGHLAHSYIVEYGNASVPLAGDANLNGTIDRDDFALTDRGAAMRLTGWSNGDFNGDGSVDAADYAILDQAFRNQPSAAFAELSVVPEPSAVVVAGVIAVSAGYRRTRNGMRRAMS